MKDHIKGYPSVNSLSTILFQNGDELKMQNNELIIAISKGNLITRKNDIVNFKTYFSSYQITSNNLIVINQIEFEGHRKLDVLENGVIIISDEFELFGTEIGVYDINLKLLHEFSPVEGGYKNAAVTASGDNVSIIISKERGLGSKYLEIEATNGNIVFQKQIERNLNLVKILSYGKKLIIVEYNKVIFLNAGDVIWEKDIVLPNYDIVFNGSQNAIYYCTKDKLLKLSANDGSELFSKYFSEIYGDVTDTTNLMIRPIVFKTNNSSGKTLILLAETYGGPLLNTIPKLNPKLF
ncbi:MAG: hypothetical protein IPL42_09640 [Saprospiraceae bacterium]|nr:hypothetical protein [Saprospiraceae bacterium]